MKNFGFLFALLFIVGEIILFSSCNRERTDDERFNELKTPIIVVAKSDPKIGSKEVDRYYLTMLEIKCTITLKDGNGKFTTFDGAKGIGASLYSTYNVKDTIK